MEKLKETDKNVTDHESMEAFHNTGLPYEKSCLELMKRRDAAEDEELKKRLTSQLNRDDRRMELYAHNSEGFIYVVSTQEEGERYGIYGCYLDSDAAYFSGMKTGKRFRIEKHPIIEEDDQAADGLWNRAGLGMGQPGGANPGAVALLSFDEAGTLMEFESTEGE